MRQTTKYLLHEHTPVYEIQIFPSKIEEVCFSFMYYILYSSNPFDPL